MSKIKTNQTYHTAIHIFLFSFFIHFFWEMWQMPLFEFDESTDLNSMNWMCTQASIGDGLIAVIAYFIVTLVKKGSWISSATLLDLLLFLIPGLLLTIILEYINTLVLFRWSYSALMPIVPVLNVGLSPLLQWVFVPIIVWKACKSVKLDTLE